MRDGRKAELPRVLRHGTHRHAVPLEALKLSRVRHDLTKPWPAWPMPTTAGRTEIGSSIPFNARGGPTPPNFATSSLGVRDFRLLARLATAPIGHPRHRCP